MQAEESDFGRRAAQPRPETDLVQITETSKVDEVRDVDFLTKDFREKTKRIEVIGIVFGDFVVENLGGVLESRLNFSFVT